MNLERDIFWIRVGILEWFQPSLTVMITTTIKAYLLMKYIILHHNEKKLELTLIGDTVNVASRVEAHCRVLEASVLVTGEFMDALSAEGSAELATAFRDEGAHMLRGRRDPVRLFSIRRLSCEQANCAWRSPRQRNSLNHGGNRPNVQALGFPSRSAN